MFTAADGKELVGHARAILELRARSTRFDPSIVEMALQRYSMEARVVVRLVDYQTKTIISQSEMVGPSPLSNAVTRAAVSVATMSESAHLYGNAMDESVVELDILSEPELLPGSFIKRRASIDPARHGIMLMYGNHKGIAMPYGNHTATEMLEKACSSIGLPGTFWMQSKVQLYRFEVQRFGEETPNGTVTPR